MTERFWTEDRVQQLRNKWAKARLVADIASALGCTRNMVIGKAYRLGLKRFSDQERNKRVWVSRKAKAKGEKAGRMNDDGFEVFRGLTIALGVEAIVACFIMAAIAFNSSRIAQIIGGLL